jgi:hypothetical protein
MVWNKEEIEAFKQRRSQGDGDVGKVDDFVNPQQDKASPRRSSTDSPRKWKPTPTWLKPYKALYSAERKGIRLKFLTLSWIRGNTNYLEDDSSTGAKK